MGETNFIQKYFIKKHSPGRGEELIPELLTNRVCSSNAWTTGSVALKPPLQSLKLFVTPPLLTLQHRVGLRRQPPGTDVDWPSVMALNRVNKYYSDSYVVN
ncbi:hypothetical protein ACTXT7_006192 [Hymenolepis weldensis]